MIRHNKQQSVRAGVRMRIDHKAHLIKPAKADAETVQKRRETCLQCDRAVSVADSTVHCRDCGCGGLRFDSGDCPLLKWVAWVQK